MKFDYLKFSTAKRQNLCIEYDKWSCSHQKTNYDLIWETIDVPTAIDCEMCTNSAELACRKFSYIYDVYKQDSCRRYSYKQDSCRRYSYKQVTLHRHEAIMLQKLSFMLLSSAQKTTYYAFENCLLFPKLWLIMPVYCCIRPFLLMFKLK